MCRNRAMSACDCLSLYGVARRWVFFEIFRRIFRYSSGDGFPSRVARPASAGPGSCEYSVTPTCGAVIDEDMRGIRF